ncbi:Eae protein [Pseudocitrobacter faecalis]|uniref:Eae protein n=1 Tax=Pseudocitrobacter faecalis TaxID=1398493 RepID=A0ABX9FW11_9ENTR|nr:hypothetical protein DFQ50_108292 [Pseudocitrobacter faecalis]
MKLFEMEGFLRGKCIPGDLKVNETNAEYLVRKLNKINELTAAHSTIEKAREVTNCPAGVDLQVHLKQLVAQSRIEGINYAASRLAAAYNQGFIDKPLSEVFDVVRMILSAKEDLATPGEDGLSGEYAEQALKDWEAELSEGKA